MSFSLVLNSSNLVGANNNTFQYNFKRGNFNIPDDAQMVVTSVQIPYSWYNITATYGNNQITFNFPTGSTTYATYNITIPDGFYTQSSFNYYLQQFMITNGFYLYNTSTGQNVYYISVNVNAFQYGNQILAYAVPTSLPAGLSIPTGFTTSTIFGGYGFPTVSRTPYFTFPQLLTTPTIGTFLGFGSTSSTVNIPAAGSTTNQSNNSTFTPQGSQVNSLIMRCSIINNPVSSVPDILDSFPIPSGTSFGTNINYTPQIEKWIKLNSGSFSSFTITFTDQNLNTLTALDSNILITLLIKFPSS